MPSGIPARCGLDVPSTVNDTVAAVAAPPIVSAATTGAVKIARFMACVPHMPNSVTVSFDA